MRYAVLCLLVACAQSAGPLLVADANEVADAGALDPDVGQEERYCSFGERRIPAGMVFSDGCNQCYCEAVGFGLGCDGSVCQSVCTSAACLCESDPDAGPGQDATCPAFQCSGQGQCGDRAPCLFDPGCDSPIGYCVHTQPGCGYGDEPNVPASNPDPSFSFCGCDGVTYSGSCPKVPYRHPGPCE